VRQRPHSVMVTGLLLFTLQSIPPYAQAIAQPDTPPSNPPPVLRAPPPSPPSSVNPSNPNYAGASSAAKLLGVPVSNLTPGNVSMRPDLKNPVDGSAEALQRGMTYFVSFNCVGCHAPNGGGGMGPSLSNKNFIYGDRPGNIYLSIYQGRPNGMPSWGSMLSDNVIWDLVSYIQSISKAPPDGWGRTISAETMKTEQVPSEYVESTAPWGQTQSFSFGQKPSKPR
jgi:cytochrome c oxidase cbb3-type subunit 3